jgi:hypothetical protein
MTNLATKDDLKLFEKNLTKNFAWCCGSIVVSFFTLIAFLSWVLAG